MIVCLLFDSGDYNVIIVDCDVQVLQVVSVFNIEKVVVDFLDVWVLEVLLYLVDIVINVLLYYMVVKVVSVVCNIGIYYFDFIEDVWVIKVIVVLVVDVFVVFML